MSFLLIKNVDKSYEKGKPVLKDFSLELTKGKITSLIGESGSGKSTLLRIIAGTENKDSGVVSLAGENILGPKEKLVPGYDEIQLVYQDYKLFPNSTVSENIQRPLLQYDKEYRFQRLESILTLLGLQPFRDKLPKELSGGQQQKVAIGRALSLEPSLILLDEPFSSLDTIQRRELIYELKTMFQKLNITVLFVTHDLDDALQMSDSLIIIRKGKIVQSGDVESIFLKPKNLYSAKLFSHLNAIPETKNSYIRPSDVSLYKSSGLKTKVVDKQYLIHYNQLTVELANGHLWQIEDKKRFFEVGDQVFLKWEKGNEISF
ncbi:ABC transporter ATP-binding protein [Mongoliibacter ruber]|uniref:Iron(III) transport system ATP-binding protein n=1 Tax=Mongoliibacter ruber TaxID=1750599 RepID=A0A2T0WD20_9BACT|nr:ABC transporter ATP-binding protein [Mongoliibacter ruber]PRY84546.1 iron(III) transport system ATP-binding protein [Mongoliibacter ruber]